MTSAWRYLYGHLPRPMQDGLISLKGLEYRFRRASTTCIRKEFEFLCESQYWTTEQFARLQEERFVQTVSAALTDVPHYRERAASLGWDPADFGSLDDLHKLPILEKSEVRGRETRFISGAGRWGVRYVNHTSGTTGTPIRTFESRLSFSRRWAFVARQRAWAGVTDPIYPRRAQFTGRDIVTEPQFGGAGPFWRRNVPGNALLLSTSHISSTTIAAYAAALRDFDPEVVDGYPSAIGVVARLSLDEAIPLCQPRAVITSAETLLPEHRADIEAAFGCRVFDQYASSEPSCFWATCEYGEMHQSPEYGISEILTPEGRPARPGEMGDVVVTSFLNPLMPLLRYRLGDTAVVGPTETCACGRQMPRVKRVVGRIDDVLYIPGRGYLGRLDPVFKGLHGIMEAQVVQVALDRLEVLVVPSAAFDQETRDRLVDNLLRKTGRGIEVAVRVVDQIPRGPNGKLTSVVTRVGHLYPDRIPGSTSSASQAWLVSG